MRSKFKHWRRTSSIIISYTWRKRGLLQLFCIDTNLSYILIQMYDNYNYVKRINVMLFREKNGRRLGRSYHRYHSSHRLLWGRVKVIVHQTNPHRQWRKHFQEQWWRNKQRGHKPRPYCVIKSETLGTSSPYDIRERRGKSRSTGQAKNGS